MSRDEKGSVRPEVLLAVSQVEPDGAAFFDLLLAAMHDYNPTVRIKAIFYFARGQTYPEMLPVLIVLFRVEVDVNHRMRIAQALGAMGAEAKPVVPMLVELIGESETNQNLRRILIRTVNAIDPQVLKPPAK